MYMCKETIRRAVIQKFKEQEEDQIETFEDLQSYCIKLFKAEDLKRLNTTVNSLKICDPAVGSGHFLVSALNELIIIKNELRILIDAKGVPLRCDIEIVNDELYVIDDKGLLHEYNPIDKESARIQHTLFHEKQTLIENCLFGVDINPNSVKICRLRLWIELLKNAYYTKENRLQTLPNIDINIKCGNSLISRFNLEDDLKDAFKNKEVNYSFLEYKNAVLEYKETNSKDRKREVLQIINEVKNNFKSTLDTQFINKFQKFKGDLINEQERQNNLKNFGEKIKKAEKDALKKLKAKAEKTFLEKEEIVNNAIYHNAFEWRFEFPEVLAEDGGYIGFDAIIGNPPYIGLEEFEENVKHIFKKKYDLVERKYETSVLFVILGLRIVKDKSLLSYIAPMTWQTGENYSALREKLFTDWGVLEIINLPFNVFADAYVDTCIYTLTNTKSNSYNIYSYKKKDNHNELKGIIFTKIDSSLISEPKYKVIFNPSLFKIIKRLNLEKFSTLGNISISTQGLSPSRFPITQENSSYVFPFLKIGNAYNYCLKIEETFNTSLRDKQNLIPFYSANEKILIRRIVNRQDRLTVGYTDERIVFKKDINPFIIQDNSFDTKYVLSVLASKFISYFYVNISSIALKDDFRQTTLTELRELFIPRLSNEEQQPFITKAIEILALKQENSKADTTVLESEIDQMVYKLYGLTAEEIIIVENS